MSVKRKVSITVALVICLATQYELQWRLIFDEPLMESVDENSHKYHAGTSNVSMADHPHAGARDENGYWNYVPDVTLIRARILQQLGSANSSRYFPLSCWNQFVKLLLDLVMNE